MPGIGRADPDMNWWSISPLWWLCDRFEGREAARLSCPSPERNSLMHKLALATAAVVAALAIAAIPATAAKKVTLRFFSQVESGKVTDTSGNPVNGAPKVGDVLSATDRDFVGNHKHHAKRYTVTDHLVCTFTVLPSTALCGGEFAIGGSMLLVEHATFDLGSSKLTFPITGGTGRYKGMTGTGVSNNVGNGGDSDVVIKLH
jgi:hypothetical protein